MRLLKNIQKLTLTTILILALSAFGNKDTHDTNATEQTTGTTQDTGDGSTDESNDSSSDDTSTETTENNTATATNNTPTVSSLLLSSDETHFVRFKRYPDTKNAFFDLTAIATFTDGSQQDVTDDVRWKGLKGRVRLRHGHLGAYEESNLSIEAQYQNITSNTLNFNVVNVEHDDAYLYAGVYNSDDFRYPKRAAGVGMILLKEPSADVHLNLHLKPEDGMSFSKYTPVLSQKLVFKSGQY